MFYNFAKFTGKHQCWSLFLIKLQTRRSLRLVFERSLFLSFTKVLVSAKTVLNCQFLFHLPNFSGISGNSKQKNFKDWRSANTIQLFVERKFFRSIFFVNMSQRMEIPQGIFLRGQPTVYLHLKKIGIYKNTLEWFLLIMCKDHILNRSSNLMDTNHPTRLSAKNKFMLFFGPVL